MNTPRQLLLVIVPIDIPGVYFIQRLANFRAQMKSAVMIVRAAFQRKFFSKIQPLLIIGGGVSGLAAGLEAGRKGMVVTLLESQKTLLSVQSRCNTRFLHPYEYDWPLPHYRKGHFPGLHKDRKLCPPSMHWKAGVASEIVEQIGRQIMAKSPSNFDIRTGSRHIPVNLEALRNNFDPDGEFEFILICAGAVERTKVNGFAGFAYWEADELENLATLKNSKKVQRVLISGGGDGGLQDLLRVTTTHPKNKPFSAGKMLQQLLPTLRKNSEFRSWLEHNQKSCKSSRPNPKTSWKELKKLISAMERDRTCWSAVSRSVLKIVDPMVRSGDRQVQLIFRDSHFSDSFALNTFLVHVLNRVMKKLRWLKARHSLNGITSSSRSHVCRGKARACFGKPHSVSVKAQGALTPPPRIYDVIVLRHGSRQVV